MREAKRLNRNTQAGRILEKFGGIRRCWERLQWLKRLGEETRGIPTAPETMYRWTYPVTKHGTGGLIPAASVHCILAAARYFDIELTEDDWYPLTITEETQGGNEDGTEETQGGNETVGEEGDCGAV